ncbi:putative adp-ribosylation factor protein [Phaeoacremonium minimum UCRPA7]|uniref:Putative adp-ribosylation factor protein n=1 Tax=Phaeoacremonium minimum (strain UCR-PA7) TaxID=1286976 RepID=R8BXR0_PHAM7|nr:putative adp-ribosylation factor protein [Phaeoacremonium minimum UCRPA7]EOO04127.1 putative adp-ribosylation factor protein [Phaeoacremonium minimum UCRPA7]
MDISSSYSASPTKENESPFDLDSKRSSATITSPPTSGVPTRAPTLSWQRRPTSQASGGSRSRPLSVVAAENAAARSSTPPAEPASPEHAVSRDQIAQALLSKDPSWFRQTADRGQNSAAYRRNQVEDEDRLDMSSMSAQLPGMSRAGSTEPERDVPTALSGSPAFPGKLGSPLPLTSAQKLDPPINMGDSSIDAIASPLSTGRTSPTRPISPTKGMGGFVQSAMMKRSDSVKRWSVTSPQGLQRAGSVASNRNSVDYKERTASPQPEATSRPGSMLRESSSRPTSSHARESPPLSIDTGTTEKAVVEKSADPEKTPPTSPSRTMDQRRWSPNKTSSWLDAALNKPESPKPKPTPPASSQPAWMVELNKAKAQKTGNTSVDLGRPGTVTKKHEVKTGGLLRSSAPGTTVKPAGLGRVNAFSSPVAANDKPAALNYRSSITKSSAEKVEVDAEDTENVASFGSPPTIKSKPETPPKKDFRAGLKPRQPPPADDKGQANELQNVFGNLRRTKTQNYVAPDELKDNILRGKAALNLTGGPKPRERKDEFKEAILKKKEDFKKAQQEGKGVTRAPGAPSEKPIPEARLGDFSGDI